MALVLWESTTEVGQIPQNIAFMVEGKDRTPHLKDRRLRETHLKGTQSGSRSCGQLGCRGNRVKHIVDIGNNTERWKAAEGSWDGSSKNNGKSGCVSRDKRRTGTNGPRSTTSRCPWVLVRPCLPKWWVSVFLRASSTSSYTRVSKILFSASTPSSKISDVVHFRKIRMPKRCGERQVILIKCCRRARVRNLVLRASDIRTNVICGLCLQ